MTIEQRLEQLEKRNKRLTIALTMMMVAIAIQFSACGKDPAGPSLTTCDVSEILATPLGERDLTSCTNLVGAILAGAILEGAILEDAWLAGADLTNASLEDANLKDVRNLPELSAKQEKDACWDDCG